MTTTTTTKTVPVSELSGAALDWAVAKCEGGPYRGKGKQYATDGTGVVDGPCRYYFFQATDFSSDWKLGGPIVERERIELGSYADQWQATIHADYGSLYHRGPTPLVAAMRCYVASKLGDTVEVPVELLD